VKIDWIETEAFEEEPSTVERLSSYDGLLVTPGFGSRGTEGYILAANHARVRDMPYLGICFGFQLAIVAFARHVCGLTEASSAEVNPETPDPVLDLMPEQRELTYKGATMRLGAHDISIKRDTIAYRLYRSETIRERHRHRWEVNPAYWNILQSHGMVFSGLSPDGRRVEVFELPSSYFYMGTQFHPEFKSRPGRPDPAYYGFVKACLEKKAGRPRPQFYA